MSNTVNSISPAMDDERRRCQHRFGVHRVVAEQFLKPYLVSGIGFTNQEALVDMVCRYAFLKSPQDADFIAWRLSFESAVNILTAAALKVPVLTEDAFNTVFEKTTEAQANLYPKYEAVMKIDGSDLPPRVAFSELLEFYHGLYEGYYREIATLFVLSKQILNDVTPIPVIADILRMDPRIKGEALRNDNGAAVPALPQLCEGCDSHLRNSIAHKRWTLVERDTINMTDESKGKVVWQEKHTIKTLLSVIRTLIRTIDAMELAVLVHDHNLQTANNGRFIIPKRFYDDNQMRDIIEGVAIERGLACREFTVDHKGKGLFLHLTVPANHTIPQVKDIYSRQGGVSRHFQVPITVVDIDLQNAVLDFLLTTAKPLSNYSGVNIRISDVTKGEVGVFDFKSEELDGLFEREDKATVNRLSALSRHKVRLTVQGESVEV